MPPLEARRLRGVARLALVATLAVAGGCQRGSYPGVGDLLDRDRTTATIAHDDIPGLMPAMTMRFAVASPEVLAGAVPGTRVRFMVRRRGGDLVLTQLEPIGAATNGPPGEHDHRPQHGGVVSMLGLIHLEAAAVPDGRVRVYLSDLWRRPLPVEGVTGTVTLDLPQGPETLTLEPVDGALEARTAPFRVPAGAVHVRISREGRPLEMHAWLGLGENRAGSSWLPDGECTAPARGPKDGQTPRCVRAFGRPVASLAATPDDRTALVSLVGGGTVALRLADGSLEHGFEPPPPVPVQAGAHADDAQATVVSPDGATVLLAMGPRLLRYTTATGRFVGVDDGPGGMIEALAWTRDGTRLAVIAAGDGRVHVLDGATRRTLTTLPQTGRALHLALDPTGALALVATDEASVTLHALDGTSPARVLLRSTQPAAGLAFASGRIVVAGTDGTLMIVAPDGEQTSIPVGVPLVGIAPSPDGRYVVTADRQRTLRVHTVPGGRSGATLAWHGGTVQGLLWAGQTIVSGDTEGNVALWEAPAP